MAMVRICYVMLGQTLNHSAYNSVILYSVISLQSTFLKKEGEAYEITILYLSVCVPRINFWTSS
jgi:hypothetical protein